MSPKYLILFQHYHQKHENQHENHILYFLTCFYLEVIVSNHKGILSKHLDKRLLVISFSSWLFRGCWLLHLSAELASCSREKLSSVRDCMILLINLGRKYYPFPVVIKTRNYILPTRCSIWISSYNGFLKMCELLRSKFLFWRKNINV